MNSKNRYIAEYTGEGGGPSCHISMLAHKEYAKKKPGPQHRAGDRGKGRDKGIDPVRTGRSPRPPAG